MSRDELLDIVLKSTGTGFCRSIGPEDLVAAAYNRAIDDASKTVDSDKCFLEESSYCVQDEVVEAIERLRIV